MNIALTTERLNELLFTDFEFFHSASNANTHEKKFSYQHRAMGKLNVHEFSIPGITIIFSKADLNKNLVVSVMSDDSKLVMRYILSGKTYTSLFTGRRLMEYTRPSCNAFFSPEYDIIGCVNAGEFEEVAVFIDVSVVEDLMVDHMVGEVDFLSKVSKKQMTSLNTKPVGLEPHVISVLNDIRNCCLSGHMQRWYIQTKVVELFLLQLAIYNSLYANVNFSSRDKEIFQGIREYLNKNYLEPQSLRDLARRFGINSSKLKVGFKKIFNQSVMHYLTQLRMEAARDMLQGQKLNIKEVSDLLNYSHANHFSAAFKKWFGVSPNTLIRK